MIEELKVLLDMLGNVDNIALYVLGGFALYKLIVYLSSAGAIIFTIKLISGYVHDIAIKRIEKPREIKLSLVGVLINEKAEHNLRSLLNEIKDGRYVHSSDIEELRLAWHKYKETKT